MLIRFQSFHHVLCFETHFFDLVKYSRVDRYLVIAYHDTTLYWQLNVLHPAMSSNLINCKALLSVCVEDFGYYIFRRCRYEFWQFVIAVKNLFIQISCIGIFEGKISSDHGVENDSAAPNVDFWTGVELSGDHFWRGVVWRTTRSSIERRMKGFGEEREYCTSETRRRSKYSKGRSPRSAHLGFCPAKDSRASNLDAPLSVDDNSRPQK